MSINSTIPRRAPERTRTGKAAIISMAVLVVMTIGVISAVYSDASTTKTGLFTMGFLAAVMLVIQTYSAGKKAPTWAAVTLGVAMIVATIVTIVTIIAAYNSI